jgi:hypothetical protein
MKTASVQAVEVVEVMMSFTAEKLSAEERKGRREKRKRAMLNDKAKKL